MEKNEPLVSIIMPVYNSEKYVREAIESVLDQTYENWELIIINDGSNDTSEEIILDFKDPRIQYFRQTNRGVSIARNIGLNNMKGHYFCFLDADDVLPPNSISSRLAIFSRNNAIKFVDGRVELFTIDSERTIGEYMPNFEGNPLFELILLSGKCFFGPTWMVKKHKQTYLFKEGLTHGEDLLFYMTICRNGGLYSFCKDSIYKYRKGHNSAMSNLNLLEIGYSEIFKEISTWEELPDEIFVKYLYKVKLIMFKSYIRTGQFFSALKALLR